MNRRRLLLAGLLALTVLGTGGCLLAGEGGADGTVLDDILGTLGGTGGMVGEVFAALADMIMITPPISANQAVMTCLTVVRTIAEALLVLAVVWSGVRGLLGLSFKSVPSLLAETVLAITAMHLTPLLVDTVAGLVNGLVAPLMRATGGICEQLAVRTLNPFATGTGLLAVMLAIVGVAVGLKLLLDYYVRLIELYFLVVVSPMMWAVGVSGGLRAIAGTWAREVGVLLVTPLAHALQLLLMSAMLNGAQAEGLGWHQTLLAVATLMFMVRTPAWLRRFVHQSPSPLAVIRDVVGAATLAGPRSLLKGVRRLGP